VGVFVSGKGANRIAQIIEIAANRSFVALREISRAKRNLEGADAFLRFRPRLLHFDGNSFSGRRKQ
jgi:hypothetical protein